MKKLPAMPAVKQGARKVVCTPGVCPGLTLGVEGVPSLISLSGFFSISVFFSKVGIELRGWDCMNWAHILVPPAAYVPVSFLWAHGRDCRDESQGALPWFRYPTYAPLKTPSKVDWSWGR
jgi:hypothetical protein